MKMSTFNIDKEVDNLVDKLTEQFKMRLKKLITRSEKLVLKQYIASQKETMRVTRGTRSKPKSKPKAKAKARAKPRAKAVASGRGVARKAPQREQEYEYNEDDFLSSDESE